MASVTINWTPSANHSCLNQTVQYKKHVDLAWSTFSTVSMSTNNATVTGLDASTSYDFRVLSNCRIGGPTSSNNSTITTSGIVYSSAAIDGLYRRNNCPGGESGTTVEVHIDAGAYTSTISQEDADNQAQAAAQTEANTEGACLVDSTLSTLLIDFQSDTTLDLCFYVKTTGLSESGQLVSSTANGGPLMYPNDGRDPATSYLLSSDKLSGPPVRRFGANMAYFIAKYTGTLSTIVFEVRGRSVIASASLGGSYAVRDITEGHLTLGGSTGSKIPGVSSGSSSPLTITTAVIAGADGTVGLTIGNPVLTLTYNFSTNLLSATTY